MATNDWDEIKRLAADFQRAQLSSTSHKLSERNCIEVVNKLIGLGLIDVIHTTDGKEYLTPNQLEREIRDELLVHGGRINLVDLQPIIRVDLSHIEAKVSELVHRDRFFSLVQGELLEKDYLDRIAEEINETLQEAGQVAVADIAKMFDLPTEFIFQVIEARLNLIIQGQIDPISRASLFTDAFIAHTIARIRGICSAVTRPVLLVQLAAQYGLSEKLFVSVLETLISSQRLSGAIQGSKEKANYMPEIYSKTQTDYIESLLKQNNYIEYQSLSRIGISDPRLYLKKRYAKRKDFIYLSTCCVSEIIIDQIDAAIEEALANDSWLDVKPLVPTPLTNEDINQLLQSSLKKCKTAEVFCETVFVSKNFVGKCASVFDPVMKSKAINDIKMSPSLFAELTKKEKNMMTDCSSGDGKQARKDERQKKANVGHALKGGGGRGARECTTKKTKNKYKNRKGNDEDEDEDFAEKATKRHELAFMSVEEIEEVLQANFEDVDRDLLQEIASHLLRSLAREYQEVAKSIFLETTLESGGNKKRNVQDQQEKIKGLLGNIRLFEKGLTLFEDDTTSTLLSKHLLKTVASEVVNVIFEMVANENLMSLGEGEIFSLDTRLKLIKKLPDKWKGPLTNLNSSLIAKTLEEFHERMQIIISHQYCDVVLKKVDKKKERQLLFNHRQSLIDELERETEAAMALHLAAVILFQYHTNTLLHAPGRCVPSIISYLQKHISSEDFHTLTSYQVLVIQQLTNKAQSVEEDDGEGKSVKAMLSEGLPKVKDVVKNMKKNQVQREEGEE